MLILVVVCDLGLTAAGQAQSAPAIADPLLGDPDELVWVPLADVDDIGLDEG